MQFQYDCRFLRRCDEGPEYFEGLPSCTILEAYHAGLEATEELKCAVRLRFRQDWDFGVIRYRNEPVFADIFPGCVVDVFDKVQVLSATELSPPDVPLVPQIDRILCMLFESEGLLLPYQFEGFLNIIDSFDQKMGEAIHNHIDKVFNSLCMSDDIIECLNKFKNILWRIFIFNLPALLLKHDNDDSWVWWMKNFYLISDDVSFEDYLKKENQCTDQTVRILKYAGFGSESCQFVFSINFTESPSSRAILEYFGVQCRLLLQRCPHMSRGTAAEIYRFYWTKRRME